MPARLTVAGEACDKSSTSNRIDTCKANSHLGQHFVLCSVFVTLKASVTMHATSQVSPDKQ